MASDANFVTDVMPKFPLMSFAKHVDFVLKVGLATSVQCLFNCGRFCIVFLFSVTRVYLWAELRWYTAGLRSE